jgi:PAS domain S-box-containing protein
MVSPLLSDAELVAALAAQRATPAPMEPPSPFASIWIDAVSDAIFVTDAASQIQQWNRAAEQIYGWPRAEALGQPIAEIIPVARYLHDDAASAMQQLRQEGVWRGTVVQHTRDGRELVMESATHELRDDQGAISGYIGINRDMTAHAALAAEHAARLAAEAAHARLQALGERLVAMQEEERRHLARELHDEIGQALTGLSLMLTTGRALPSEVLHAQLDAIQRQVASLIAQVRQRSLDLRPSMLDDLGLHPALVWYFTRYSEQTRIRLAVELQGVERRFPPLVELTAYRIVQEALTNVARHAGVEEAIVLAWVVDAQLMIEVSDQGRGFDHDMVRHTHASTGLIGMRERVALLGGELTIETAPGAGTRLFAALPFIGPAATLEEAP